MKTIVSIFALVLSTAAWSDGQAPITFSGKGKDPIEVRDPSGNVTEVRGSSDLRLNQIPADAIAREEAARARQKELAEAASAERAEEAAEIEADQKAVEEQAAADAKSQAEATAEAEAAAKLKAAQHPKKIRGKTVRGTRFVENPVIESDTPPPPRGPVLSASGDKPKQKSTETEAPADAPKTP